MAFGSVLCLSMIPGQMPVVMHPVAVAAESTEEAVVMNSVKYILVTEADRTYYQGTEVIDKNITSVIIPAEINGKSAEIHQNIFSQCPNLKEIIIQEGNIYNTSADGVLFSDGGYKMLAYELKNLSVLESVIYYEPETYIEGMNREKQDNASETISIKMEKKQLYIPAFPTAENCGDFTVYGDPGNEILKYSCEYHNMKFEPLQQENKITGDINNDDNVDILDVILINKAIYGKTELTEAQRKAADVNNDGKPDANDSLIIMKYIIKLIDTLSE